MNDERVQVARVRTTLICLLSLLALVAPVSVGGQQPFVEGTLETAATGEPLATAIVYLLDDESNVVGATLSDSAGAFRLPASGPGQHRLLVERIGIETTELGPFDIPEGGLGTLRGLVEVRPVEIPGVSVTADRVCDLNENAGRLIDVWSETRKVLTASMLADAGVRFSIEVRERELSRDLDVIAEAADTLFASIPQAFGFEPVDQLGDAGWGGVEDGSVSALYGPSPNLLLSPWFASHHCLGVETNSADSLVGLAFSSIEDDLEIGIEGTFWLERDSWELRRIEFRFKGLPDLQEASEQGGVVRLAEGPWGSWYVQSWYIRRPIWRVDLSRLDALAPGSRSGESLRRIDGYAERSGRVLGWERQDPR